MLVLSQFSGSASSLLDAVIVNPYDVDGTAEATYRALRMPLAERRSRSKTLMEGVLKHDASAWSESFLHDLGVYSAQVSVV